MKIFFTYIFFKIILLLRKKNSTDYQIKSFDIFNKNYLNYAFFKNPQPLAFKSISFILQKLKIRRYCIDIGAEIGTYSILFSSFYEKVISYEPIKTNFNTLKLNTSNYKNIKIFNYAIGNNVKKKFYLPDLNYGGSTIKKNKNYKTEIVRFKNFPKKISYLKKIDLVKIDVEGDENNVLKSLIRNNLFKFNNPLILIEKSKQFNLNTIQVLKEIGYNFCYEVGHNIKHSNNFLLNKIYFIEFILKCFITYFFNKKFATKLLKIDNDKTYSNLLLSKNSLENII
jgi:FkbM family methyltransferase